MIKETKYSKQLLLILLFALFAFNFSVAQTTSGKVSYTVYHNWVKKVLAVDYMSKTEKDKLDYTWGKSADYELNSNLFFNSKSYKYEEFVDNTNHTGYSYRSSEYIIFRNRENNQTYDVIRLLNKLYIIEDSIAFPKWKILNDLKEVAGHICMNAYWYDSIKMHEVVAWFALDWAESFGPEDFGGLPGMILEIDINNGAKRIVADKIDFYASDSIIELPVHKKKHKNVSKTKYDNIFNKYIEECKKEKRPYFWGSRY